VTALAIVAGAVAVTQALPQRAAAFPRSERAAAWTAAEGTPAGTQAETSAARAAASAQRAASARAAARLRAAAKVSRSTQRTRIGSCDARAVTRGSANGRIALRDLCRLSFAREHLLRADAAVALMNLDVAYRARFHRHLDLTDSYRSYAAQVSVAARKPGLAARPGTSEHGWGLAVDLAGGAAEPGAREHEWLLEHAPAFGWDNPPWARPGGSRPEAWHWEYRGGRTPSR
jgi:LAS superfamily LD-carboxypeptidase LdcB